MTGPGGGPPPRVKLEGAPTAAAAARLLRELGTAQLAPYLATRRWFGAKGTTPSSVTARDVVPLPEEPGSAPAVVAQLEVRLPDGRVERYQLPVVLRPLGGARDVPEADIIAIADAQDGSTHALLDAVHDESFRRRLAHGLESGTAHGGDGEGVHWELRPLEGANVTGLSRLPSRVGSAEQSNTSILLGDRAILKLFRRLETGQHPDVEIAHALTTRTRFRNTPTLLGTIVFVAGVDPQAGNEDVTSDVGRTPRTTVAGMLQELVPGASDAWALALDAARAVLRAPGAPTDMPPNPFADEMRELGRVTRGLHDALASLADVPGFEGRGATATDVGEWGARVRDMVHDSTALLAAARSDGRLRGADVASADAVLRRRAEVLGDLEALVIAIGDRPGRRIRHHGDYHLGQVLRAADGRYMVIDFEGEPARPLAERRAAHSPLRDVAGMLRSFAYATAAVAMEVGGVGTNAAVEVRGSRWERALREAFLAGYLEPGGADYLPSHADEITYLILLFEMEKVFYELAYELNNRPDWVWIPLRGIARLLGSPSMPQRGAP